MITRAEHRSRYLSQFSGDLLYLSQIRARKETRKAKINFAHVSEKIADRTLRILIVDTGIGIPHSEQGRS